MQIAPSAVFPLGLLFSPLVCLACETVDLWVERASPKKGGRGRTRLVNCGTSHRLMTPEHTMACDQIR